MARDCMAKLSTSERWILREPSPPNVAFQPRRAENNGADGCKRMLAGPLKSKNLFSCRLRNIDKRELIFVKQIVFSALIDDAHKAVFGGSRIGHDRVDLAPDQRGLIAFVFETQCEVFC